MRRRRPGSLLPSVPLCLTRDRGDQEQRWEGMHLRLLAVLFLCLDGHPSLSSEPWLLPVPAEAKPKGPAANRATSNFQVLSQEKEGPRPRTGSQEPDSQLLRQEPSPWPRGCHLLLGPHGRPSPLSLAPILPRGRHGSPCYQGGAWG